MDQVDWTILGKSPSGVFGELSFLIADSKLNFIAAVMKCKAIAQNPPANINPIVIQAVENSKF